MLAQKPVTVFHFLRFLRYSPYFIWHDISDVMSQEGLSQFAEGVSEEGPLFEWFRDDEDVRMQFLYQKTLRKHEQSLLFNATFKLLEDAANRFFHKNFKSCFYVPPGPADRASQATLKAICSGKYDLIINPVFCFENAVAKPKAYAVRTCTVYGQNYTSGTKRVDWYKMWWLYHVTSKTTPVNHLRLLVLASGPNLRGEVCYVKSACANTQVTPPPFNPKSVLSCSRYGTFFLKDRTLHRCGTEATTKKANQLQLIVKVARVLNNENYNKLILQQCDETPKRLRNNKVRFFGKLFSLNFTRVLRKITLASHYTEYKTSLLEEVLWDNHLKNDLLPALLIYHKDLLANVSGKLVNSKQVTNAVVNNHKDAPTGLLAWTLDNHQVVKQGALTKMLAPLLRKNARVLWYDFEGFSLPTATLDHFLPFQQTIFQVSLKETTNTRVTHVKNLVFDPQCIKGDDFIAIINAVYALQADLYVVYNAGYENARLREMQEWLQSTNHPGAQDAAVKVKWIVTHTFDLARVFLINSNKVENAPPVFLPELRGRYSIKLLEKHVTLRFPKLAEEIRPYASLDVQNGLMAMEIAASRALRITGDKAWSNRVEELKVYCANDVASMIMVFRFACTFLKQTS